MRKLLKAYKTEIAPNKEQIAQIHNTIGACRIDRDLNASINLKQTKEYTVLV